MVAQQIRRIRQNRDLSQDNMADELGITKGAYSKIERGITAISVNRLNEIAKILKVDIGSFFNYNKPADVFEEPNPHYGFATKSDIEELQKLLSSLKEELNIVKKELLPVKRNSGSQKKVAK